MRLALILDKSAAFIGFERDRVLERWNAADSDRRNVSSFGEVGEVSLLGAPPVSFLELSGPEDVKKLLEALKKLSPDDMRTKLAPGLVIHGSVNRNSTRKLEALVTDLGGEVILSKANSKDRTNIVEKLLRGTALTWDVKRFIIDYSGDEYDSMLSFIRNVGDLTAAQQKRITVEDVVIRTPQSEGSIPPWDIEKPLMSGDIEGTIRNFRRIVSHSHPLVVISVVKNKLTLSYRVAALMDSGTRTLPEISRSLGVPNNYPLKLARESATRLGSKKLEKLLHIVTEMESNAKGGSSANLNASVEVSLVEMCIILRR